MSDLEARIVRALERHPEVLVAYLFGSRARGTDRRGSDVDVAVLLREDDDARADAEALDRRLALIADLSAATGTDGVDVVVLNEAPVALAYRVLRDGRLLVSRDDRARIEHWVRTVDRYIDMAPFRRVQEEGLRHRLREGRFGRS